MAAPLASLLTTTNRGASVTRRVRAKRPGSGATITASAYTGWSRAPRCHRQRCCAPRTDRWRRRAHTHRPAAATAARRRRPRRLRRRPREGVTPENALQVENKRTAGAQPPTVPIDHRSPACQLTPARTEGKLVCAHRPKARALLQIAVDATGSSDLDWLNSPLTFSSLIGDRIIGGWKLESCLLSY